MGPAVLALVIGINKYTSDEYDDLAGASADADAFNDFLKQRLGVDEENIINLRDEAASREAILQAFYSIRDNFKYEKNEAAIIIYYAGHGAQVAKPDEWADWVTSTGKIEMLCPSDIGATTKRTVDGEEYEETTFGIPDRTVSTILNHISSIKGNNITLILDCCSSGGISRGYDVEEGYVARHILKPPPIKPTTDERIWLRGARGGPAAEGWMGKFHASHVLLAACGRDQFALENPKTKRGLFTQMLLKALESENLLKMTYISLMHAINMPPWQTPHCEGQGINWRLFNNRDLGADASLILTKRGKDGAVLLQAGEAQGVTCGSRYAVHATNLINTSVLPNPCLGYVVVNSLNAFSSSLVPAPTNSDFQPPKLCYSKLVEATDRKISLYCGDKSWLETVFTVQIKEQLSVFLVDDVESCDLQLTVLDGKVYFDRYSKLVVPHIGSRIRHTIDVDNVAAIRNVVKRSLHFYYQLTRTGRDDFKNVWMELKVLTEELSKDFDLVLKPIGKNLIEDNPATIVVDEKALLGMMIFNQTDLSIYPYLFYFDPTDLTIINWFKPPFGAGQGSLTTRVDAPLPPKSQLSIGYGDGGVDPWQFLIPEGESKDIGFFKLFISTVPAYFDSVLQDSPFDLETSRAGKPTAPEPPNEQKWAAQLVTVIQVDK